MTKTVLLRWLPLVAGLASCLLLFACGADSAVNPTLPVSTTHLTGSSHTVLMDSRGFTLYFYLPDTPTRTACAGGCAKNWPPLLATASDQVHSRNPLPGKLTIQRTGNGNQVEYNRHLLYTYIGDTAPGQMTGNGINEWYVATTDLQPPTA